MIATPLDDRQDAKLDPQLEYRVLIRSLKYTQGFGLLFVQCAPTEGARLLERVREDLPKKRMEVLELKTPIENLYNKVDELFQDKPIDVLFVQGIEHSLYDYENNRLWSDDAQRRSYSETGVPRLLQHLNLSRERFRESFPFHFVFIVTHFALKYLTRRAPDFFDWNSGVLEFTRHNDWNSGEEIEDIRRQARTLQKGVDWEICEEAMAYKSHQSDRQKASHSGDNNFDTLKLYEAIIASYEKILGRKLDESEAWLKRGIGLSNSRKYQEAVASYKKALEFKPDDHRILYRLGITLSKLGCDEEAVVSYRKVLEFERDKPEVWNNLGAALTNLGDYKEAIVSYDKALQIKPNKDKAWYNRGIALRNLERYEEAIASYDKALQFNPDDHAAWYNRGNALRNLERYEEAIASYDKALQFNPNDHEAWNNRGIALDSLGRYEEEIASYDKALQLNPAKHEAWYNRGIALSNLGRYEEEIASYDKALQLNPREHKAFYNKARCCALQTQTEAAIANLSRAIALNPGKYRDMAKTDSDFDSIRQDERFQSLVNEN
jgi:tetratricopeptide (TPR) repeat protein